MVPTAGQTPFFALPLELRQLIYESVLASPLHGPELLRTCREIFAEAHEFLFERPLSFQGQLALFRWLDQVPPKFLPHVKKLSLSLQDVDLRSLVDTSALVHHPGDPPRLLTWDLYETELERLCIALRRLPKVLKISVKATTGRQSFLYREFLRRFLVELSLLLPELVDIDLGGNFHHQDLTFLSGFKKLQVLSFDGFSASSPVETARILSGLECLTTLSLVSQNTLLTPDSHTHSSFTTKLHSLTGGVINAIDQLRIFSVTEIIPASAPSLFFTPEVLVALSDKRRLKKIQVCLSQAPNNETMAALENFLQNTHVTILELDWPQLDPHMWKTFSLIPRDLETLWVRAKDTADALKIIWYVTKSREAGYSHALNELVILRSTQSSVDSVSVDRKDSCTGVVECDSSRVSLCSNTPVYPYQHAHILP